MKRILSALLLALAGVATPVVVQAQIVKVAVVGDSISAHPRPIHYWTDYVATAPYNFAVAGATTTDMLDSQLPSALATDASVVVVFGGTNDLTSSPYPLGPTEGNLTSMASQIAAAGKIPLLVAPLPRCTGDPALTTALKALRAWMLAYNATTVDPWPQFDDGFGCMRSDLTVAGDTTHPNEDGEMVLAGLVGQALPRAGLPTVPTPTVHLTAGGGMATVTWANIPNPHAQDWVGVFPVGAVDTGYVAWSWVNCTNSPTSYTVAVPSGSCSYPEPAGGIYEVRVFANNSFALVTTSASVTI